MQKREELKEKNSNLVGNVLNSKELAVNEKLQEMKAELFGIMDEDRLYKMNLLANVQLYNSRLYKFIKALPKGSDLHVHATSLLPANRQIDFVAQRSELVVDITDCHIYNINESGYNKANVMPMAQILKEGILTREQIETKWTMLGRQHNTNVWEYFESMFPLFDSLEYSAETLYEYYVYAFEYYLENNVFHIEIHALFSDEYEKSLALANTIKRAYFTVKQRHPELMVSIICAGLKYLGVEPSVPEMYLNNALKLRKAVVDDFDKNNIHPFIIGFDLLNEEDKSIPLKELAPVLLKCRNENPDFNLYIHCGESLNAQSDNLIDGYLLGAARVGHGMNLYRFPDLLNKYVNKEICLEACPISNKTLRYVKDLRLHPVAEYLKRGVTVALCSDDPVCQEHETLTDDFFAGTVCWDLNLADIKQLCINSILYAGVEKSQKSELLASFKTGWQKFIDEFSA